MTDPQFRERVIAALGFPGDTDRLTALARLRDAVKLWREAMEREEVAFKSHIFDEKWGK
jgi:hypothetical protein